MKIEAISGGITENGIRYESRVTHEVPDSLFADALHLMAKPPTKPNVMLVSPTFAAILADQFRGR